MYLLVSFTLCKESGKSRGLALCCRVQCGLPITIQCSQTSYGPTQSQGQCVNGCFHGFLLTHSMSGGDEGAAGGGSTTRWLSHCHRKDCGWEPQGHTQDHRPQQPGSLLKAFVTRTCETFSEGLLLVTSSLNINASAWGDGIIIKDVGSYQNVTTYFLVSRMWCFHWPIPLLLLVITSPYWRLAWIPNMVMWHIQPIRIQSSASPHQGSLASESAVLKLSGKQFDKPFKGPVSWCPIVNCFPYSLLQLFSMFQQLMNFQIYK